MKKVVREKAVEMILKKAVDAAGGLCVKLSSIGFDGMPDRLALMPGGYVYFVELKAPGGRPTLLQLQRHALLKRLGFQVYVVDSPIVAARIVETWARLQEIENVI